VLLVASWRHIFIGLGVYGAVLAVWMVLRLPETLPLDRRRPLSVRSISEAVWATLRIRQSIGNTVAQTMLMGALFAFIGSIQQIVFDVFRRPELIGIVFACIAGPMAFSSYANSRLVMRFGSKRLLLLALAGFTLVALIHLAAAEAVVREDIWMFVILQAATMSFFGLIGANAGALAMEPLGHIAGTASSVQGVITTIGGALIGFAIGQQFDGTTLPFLIGFAACGTAALAIAFWANRPPAQDSHDRAEVEVQETATRPG
jgi:DHA1 family bicyclomycin/chloramphenicol resistance-like MFS transporter